MIAGKYRFAAALIAAATPALARQPGPTTAPVPTPVSVPEPSDAGLFLLGAIGVAAGRWMHARRARQQNTDRSGE